LTTRHTLTGEIKAIGELALPVVGAQMCQMALSTTDVLMAGRLGAVDLAAVAVANNAAIPMLLFMMGVLMAVNPIVAQLVGAGNFAAIPAKLRHALVLAGGLTVPAILFVVGLRPLLLRLGIETEVVGAAMAYIRALACGIPFVLGYYVLRFYNEGLSRTKPILAVTLASIPLNILGNWILIYGHWGFPRMGVTGIGLSTALVWLFMLGALYWITARRPAESHGHTEQGSGSWHDFAEILSIGVPNGVSIAMEISMFAIIALVIGSLGVRIVAAHQIAINIAAVVFMVPLGISTATSIRVGQAAGRGSLAAIRQASLAAVCLTLVVTGAFALMLATIPDWLVGHYTSDEEVAAAAVSLLFYSALFQISDGLQVSCTGVLRGLKDTRIPMLANGFSYWLVGLPLGWYLGMARAYGARGFWIGMVGGLTMAALLHGARVLYKLRRNGSLLRPTGPTVHEHV